MQPFYLSKNEYGYYRVMFINQETGEVISSKSSHTKNKTEASMIATEWLRNGTPDSLASSRKFANEISSPTHLCGLNLESIANRVSESEAEQLISLLSKKFNFNNSQKNIEPTSVIVSKPKVLQPEQVKQNAKEKPIILIDYLLKFWDFDNSKYLKRQIALGHSFTQRHCKDMVGIVKRYWQTYFEPGTTVQSLTKDSLMDFFFYLRLEKELSADTVNKTISCANKPINYLFDEHKISVNPMQGVERFSVKAMDRGIPTETEMKQLMQLKWPNYVSKLAFKVSSMCGLRAGEISGLQSCDVDRFADLLYIRHSWSETDGLKSTKNGDSRTVPIDHTVAIELLRMARSNPEYSDTSFVFYSPKMPSQPYWPSYYCDAFYEALEAIGISEEQRKERNIVFHSLRHYCATMLKQRAGVEAVKAVLGHRSAVMSEHYSDHETEQKLDLLKNAMKENWAVVTA